MVDGGRSNAHLANYYFQIENQTPFTYRCTLAVALDFTNLEYTPSWPT